MTGIVKFLKRQNKPLYHSHFIYQGLFNNVYVQQRDCNCSVEHQSGSLLTQRNFGNKTEQLIYYGDEMCIFFMTTTTTSLRPSEATAKREFIVVDATIDTLLGLSGANSSRVYVEPEKITEIFTAEVISYTSYDQIITELKAKVDSTIVQLIQSNQEQSNQEQMLALITSMQSTLGVAESCGKQRRRVLNCELPYSEWLYTLARDNLVPLGFVVSRESGDKPLVNSNEFLGGRKDLLIYHPGKCEAVIEILHIGVKPSSEVPSDVLTLDSNTATIRKCNIYQGVAELKVSSINPAAENECYYNMFAEAIKLTMKILAAGKLVKKAVVYGIVVATHQHQHAQLLKLTIEFEVRKCTFYKSATTADFSKLLNIVIQTLDK